MSTADERLVVMLEARISEFERRMRQAEQQGTRTYQGLSRNSRSATRQMEQDMVRSTGRINQALASTTGKIGALGTALAGGLSVTAAVQIVRRYTQIADAATKMQNALRVAGLDGEELSSVYEKLFQSAQRNAAPINSLVDLYSKLALTQNELGVTSDELIEFTDGIAVALKVAGTDATAASGSLLQLSQALGGGVVRAEEFNSILEGTPTIAQAVARGLKEAGGSVAELRKLIVNGEVSSTAFFRAFEAGSAELRRQAETSQTTVGQAFTRIANSLVTVIGDFDRASGLSGKFARSLGGVAEGLDNIDAEGFVAKIQSIIGIIQEADAAFKAWAQNLDLSGLTDAMGLSENGQIINPDVSEAEGKIKALEKEVSALQAQIENNTNLGFDNTEAMARLGEVRAALAAVRAEAANLPRYVQGIKPDGTIIHNLSETGTGITSYSAPPKPAGAVEPVSIEDHPVAVVPSAGGGGCGRRGGRSGGGGSRAKEKQDEFAKEVEGIRDRTAALEAEAAVLVTVAASGQDYGDALEFARQKAELLHAAQKAGKQITPELEAEIDKLADAYVQAGLAAEGAADKLDAIAERSRIGKDVLTDLFGSILDGSKSAKQAVADLLMEIAKAQMMSAIFKLPGMGGIASSIGSMLVPAFASGGDHSGGLRIVGERGPELEATGPSRIWNADQTRNMLAGSQPKSSGQEQSIRLYVMAEEGDMFRPTIRAEAEGVTVKVVDVAMRGIHKQLPDKIEEHLADRRKR